MRAVVPWMTGTRHAAVPCAGDAKAGGGVSGGWRERGGRPGPGQRQRQEYEGRPGLRRRATRDEDGDDDEAGGRAGPRGWGGDEDGPDEQQQEVRPCGCARGGTLRAALSC